MVHKIRGKKKGKKLKIIIFNLEGVPKIKNAALCSLPWMRLVKGKMHVRY